MKLGDIIGPKSDLKKVIIWVIKSPKMAPIWSTFQNYKNSYHGKMHKKYAIF